MHKKSFLATLSLLATISSTFWLVNSKSTPPPAGASERAGRSIRPLAAGPITKEEPNNPKLPEPPPLRRNPANSEHCRVYQRPELAPKWTIGYGSEFWRKSANRAHATSPATVKAQLPPSIDLGDVVDRVSHAFSLDSGQNSASVQAKTYGAQVDGSGLRFLPHRPAWAANQELGVTSDRLLDANDSGSPRADPEPDATFRTLSVRVCGQALYRASQPGPQREVIGNTAQALLNESFGLIEHYEANSEGVAVTWLLNQPVSSIGSLELEAQLEGLAYAGQTAEGFHFADTAGTARVRVGNTTVVDALGRKWAVPSSFEENHLFVSVPAAILAEATYPLAIDPVIGAEFGMDLPILSPALGTQWAPAVASNGSDYLVVWQTTRSDGTGAIYGTRLRNNGTVADPDGIPIGLKGRGNTMPAVSSDGSDYLVVWEEARTGVSDIYGARVSSEGRVLDPSEIRIHQSTSNKVHPTAAYNGDTYLVVWEKWGSLDDFMSGIYGAKLSRGGAVLDASPIVVNVVTNDFRRFRFQTQPVVAANGGEYFVVWEDSRKADNRPEIQGVRVSGAGIVESPAGFVIGTGRSPTVASNGTDYLVAWSAASGVAGKRFSGSGLLPDTNEIVIAPGGQSPAIASNGSDYLVLWQVSSTGYPLTNYATRVSSAGAVLDATPITVSPRPAYNGHAVGSNGKDYLVAWAYPKNSPSDYEDIIGARIGSDGSVQDSPGITLSTSSNNQLNPAVGSSGNGYLVVWQDSRNDANGFDIYGVRVSLAGTVTDPAAIPISVSRANQLSPAVTSNGAEYFVVWEDQRNGIDTSRIWGTRINFDGAVLDTNGVQISRAPSQASLPEGDIAPAVASDGLDYFVTWQNGGRYYPATILGARVLGARVTREAAVSVQVELSNTAARPAVASNGSNYFVVWADFRSPSARPLIYGTTVSQAGVVQDTAGKAIVPIDLNQDFLQQDFPAIASNGTDYLVAWQEHLAAHAARVSGAGTVLDTNGFLISGGSAKTQIVVAANGKDYLSGNYFVAWNDSQKMQFNEPNIFGVRVNSEGQSLGSELAVTAGTSPKLAPGSLGTALLVSQSPESLSSRIQGRIISVFEPITVRSSIVTLTWLAQPGKTYRVQFSPDLNSQSWTDLSGDVTANGGTAFKIDSSIGNAPQRFYRITELP